MIKKCYIPDVWFLSGLNDLGKIPAMVNFGTPVIIVSVASGSRHALALSNRGEVFSWGWGVQGQLGHGESKSLMFGASQVVILL